MRAHTHKHTLAGNQTCVSIVDRFIQTTASIIITAMRKAQGVGRQGDRI